ncbi:MAG: EAL domain-containing protein [Cyanobacteria bacterium P01_F01_bin.143]
MTKANQVSQTLESAKFVDQAALSKQNSEQAAIQQEIDEQKTLLNKVENNQLSSQESLLVVGLGASAGGLQALESFFSHMPQNSGAAFVIIQHLSPDYKNLMKELLGRCTRMAIHRVEEGMVLEANSVYLIPPGQNLVVSGGSLHLTQQERLNRSHPNFPINLFFDSLAEDYADRSIAIVLSGSGSDGSRGIQAIHEAKGITLVQDPATAEFDGMPQSAIKTGCVDRILPPPALAQLVYQIVSNPSDLTAFRNADPFILVQKNQLQKILRLLITDGGIDFRQYKSTTLSRRIQRRCLVAGVQDLGDYLQLLETSAEERRQLQKDLLISVTRFFRDPDAWQFLETDIFPALIDNMSAETPLRIWVTACATGEEAYSMAILADELATAQGKPVHAKIFATDIATHCLDYAAQGIYPSTIAKNVSPTRLKRYFTKKGDTYEIIRSIRDMIVFAPHNLLRDAGFSRMHLISCRNVLIYMEPALQQQVIKRLHFSLLQSGILFLGESENLSHLEDEFIVHNQRLKIYSKRRNVRLTHSLPEKTALMPIDIARSSTDNSLTNFGNDIRLQEAFRFLMSEQQGCCLIANERGHLIHAFGATPQILPPPNGSVSYEVVKMVALPLQLPLSAALNHARKAKGFVHYSAIELNSDKGKIKVNLRVLFQEGSSLVEDFFIVLIQPREYTTSPSQELNVTDIGKATMQQTLELESELQRTRESLQATIEELETTNEEQQSTNEELIASNEELQSTNEELQSVNEELYTVNAEYQATIQNLTELNNDINNLLQVSEIGVIFLDQEMRVRKFTSAATQVFALMPSDIGRPINHLAHKLDLKDLDNQLADVLETKSFSEQKVKLIDSENHLLMRIYPYERQDSQSQSKNSQSLQFPDPQTQLSQMIDLQRQEIDIDGVVLTFVDVTAMEQAQKALTENNILLKTVINSISDPIIVKDLAGRYQLANESAAQLFKQSVPKTIGMTAQDIFSDSLAQKMLEDDRKVLDSGKILTFEETLPISDQDNAYYLTTKTVFRDEQGKPLGIVGFSKNVTTLKESQNNLEQANRELQAENLKHQKALGALQESETRFRNTFEQAAVGIVHIAPEGMFIRINQRFADILGYAEKNLVNNSFENIIHPDDLATSLKYRNQLLADEIPAYTTVERYIRSNKTIVWVNVTVALVRKENGDPDYIIAVVEDITLQKELEVERDRILRELSHEKELAQITLHSISDAVITTDAQAKVRYCNPVAEELMGWSVEEAQGKPIQEVVTLLGEQNREPVPHPATTILTESQHCLTVDHLILQSRDGHEFTVNTSASQIRDLQGNLLGVVTVFRDVTEAHQLSQKLSWQASHDSLTGLINRSRFEQIIDQVNANAQVDDRQEHILCYLDLDQFKAVNDTCGHLAGDELLRQVATLLKNQVRNSDCLARLGGDEFGVLLRHCPLSRATAIAEGFRKSIQDFRFVWENRTFNIGVSIGLVTLNSETVDVNSALNAADAACYIAKERGRNRIYIYQPDDASVTRQRSEREWSFRIRRALEQNQFCLYQQPIVPVKSSSDDETNSHFEILLRMIGEDKELISPEVFIGSAERYDLMSQIDRWVVTNFLKYLAAQSESESHYSYMINLSGVSLTDESFLEFLKEDLSANSIIAQRICFEITETAAISNLGKAIHFITEIKQLGCKFALDDFGSGMSSFGYLKALPVDYIKIDGNFVTSIAEDPTTKLIVEAINSIGHGMKLQIVAESVEDDETKHYLQEIGVDYLQGYALGRPKSLT